MMLGTEVQVKRYDPETKRPKKKKMVLMEKYRFFGLFVDEHGIRECFTWQQLRHIEQGEGA